MAPATPELVPANALPRRLASCRRRADRRRQPARLISRHTVFGGRRRAARRASERRGYIPDMHGPALFVVVTAVAALNILDAFFTLLFLAHGGRELNPLIDQVLRLGTWPFFAVKSVGIGVCIGFLTITKNFRLSRIGLGVILVGYSALLCWHLYLLGHLPE
jgi:hypothetical protein